MSSTFRGLAAATTFAIVITGLAFTARTSARTPQQTTGPADLVITNGKVVTVEDGAPDAQAVASRGGKIVAVGTNAEIQKFVGPKTEVLDVKGQLVIPGFIEGRSEERRVGKECRSR